MINKIKVISNKVIKLNLPDVSQQEDWSCGAAILLSILLYFGKGPINEEMVGEKLKMD